MVPPRKTDNLQKPNRNLQKLVLAKPHGGSRSHWGQPQNTQLERGAIFFGNLSVGYCKR